MLPSTPAHAHGPHGSPANKQTAGCRGESGIGRGEERVTREGEEPRERERGKGWVGIGKERYGGRGRGVREK